MRLEINDLSSTGSQPFHDKDDAIHAVVNGEIYEYERLRAEMIQKLDYNFQGRSDCELVLALYKYYGFSFVSHLRGEFSLCLYDSERDLFIAVRDRYGIKPLFWTIVDGELLVAAEMKAFLPLGWTPEWDIKSVVDGSFQISAGTIFKGVQKVGCSSLHLDTPYTHSAKRCGLGICLCAGTSELFKSSSTGIWIILTKYGKPIQSRQNPKSILLVYQGNAHRTGDG